VKQELLVEEELIVSLWSSQEWNCTTCYKYSFTNQTWWSAN